MMKAVSSLSKSGVKRRDRYNVPWDDEGSLSGLRAGW